MNWHIYIIKEKIILYKWKLDFMKHKKRIKIYIGGRRKSGKLNYT